MVFKLVRCDTTWLFLCWSLSFILFIVFLFLPLELYSGLDLLSPISIPYGTDFQFVAVALVSCLLLNIFRVSEGRELFVCRISVPIASISCLSEARFPNYFFLEISEIFILEKRKSI